MADDINYNSAEYRSFRFHVMTRDKFLCQLCKTKGGELNSHHIKKWSSFPNLRYVISNGITLCKMCHELVTGREEQYEEQFKKIIATTNGVTRKPDSRKRGGINKLPYIVKNPRNRI